ncbi:YkoP family protein [Pseudalkalibacillus sp. A8]|uniref:YkoP family protein n=1 Tax=Pseudalkalibacillus sp. A8 TaxID=3382641 RepID=UPI0038B5703D
MEIIRSYAISIWSLWDPLYYSLTRLTYIEKGEPAKCVFRVRLTKYKGSPTLLNDGTQINKNDLLVKIHLHNVRLLQEMRQSTNDFQKVIQMYRHVQQSMPFLAAYVKGHEQYGEIKGIIGITLLNEGTKKLGFESFSLKSKLYRMFKLTSLLPIYLLFNQNKHAIFGTEPRYLMMSKEQLIERYHSKN